MNRFLLGLLYVSIFFLTGKTRLYSQEHVIDQFNRNVSEYSEIDEHDFLLQRLPPPGGILEIRYDYQGEGLQPVPWGAGLFYDIEENSGTFCGLTDFAAVEIQFKGDGTFNAFHFELVETVSAGSGGDGETWASPNISLSDTTWKKITIPMSHFRRLTDTDNRSGISDYIEGDSSFIANIARYYIILTGKGRNDFFRYLQLKNFRAVNTPPVSPIFPVIDDFELNTPIHYPVPCGNSLPMIQYNYAIRQSEATALQIHFNPLNSLEMSLVTGTGGLRIELPNSIELAKMTVIRFYLKGDGSDNALVLQLGIDPEIETDATCTSPKILLSDTDWREVQVPLCCFSPAIDCMISDAAKLRLTDYHFIFSGSDATDERSDFIFIDAFQFAETLNDAMKIRLPVIDSFEAGNIFYLEKFGPGNPDWSLSAEATSGDYSLAITYQPALADTIVNNWGAGLRRIFPEALDFRFYDSIEFDLAGNGSGDSVRLELVESCHAPADGETWASDFFPLNRVEWLHQKLDLNSDFRLLIDRTAKLYPAHQVGNQVRNHQFSEYRLIFTGFDSAPEKTPIRLDNIRLNTRQMLGHDTFIDSVMFSEQPFSPWRGDLIVQYRLKVTAEVRFKIYRLSGEQMSEIISNGYQEPGLHQFEWNGTNQNGELLPNGLYLALFKVRPISGTETDGLDHPKFIGIFK